MKKEKNYWPLAILGIGILFILVTAWSVYKAAISVSSVTDPGYYSHGLKYNNTSIEILAASTLGWKVRSEVADDTISIALVDGESKPVSGATGQLTLRHISGDHPHETMHLKELTLGVYSTELPGSVSQSTVATLALDKQGASIQRQILINL